MKTWEKKESWSSLVVCSNVKLKNFKKILQVELIIKNWKMFSGFH